MPVFLREVDAIPEIDGRRSILIVPCRFCPAACLAVRRNEPYIELLRRFLKTASLERFIDTLKRSLESRGIKTSVFKSRLIHQFVLCMWTSRRRTNLRKRAMEHDAVLVVGFEAAGETVRHSVESTGLRVIQAMRSEGIMRIKPRFHAPCNLSLELESVSPLAPPATMNQTRDRD